MQISFLRTSRPLKIGMLIVMALVSVSSWFLLMDTLRVEAAPPPQPLHQGPGIQGINHTCFSSLMENPLNDTYNSATPLVAGSPVQTHSLDSGGPDGPQSGTYDKDWFSFTTPANQVFTISVNIPAGSLLTTTEISLYTSTLSGLVNPTATVTTRNGNVTGTALASPNAQTFWVRVVNPYAEVQTTTLTGDAYFCDVFYEIQLRHAGNLNHSGTQKTAEVDSNQSLTYTLILSNTGELLNSVVVTDVVPAGVNVTGVDIPPLLAGTDLEFTSEGLTWTGWLPGYTTVQFTIHTTVTRGITEVQNTAWINPGTLISRTSAAVDVPAGFDVMLPVIIKP